MADKSKLKKRDEERVKCESCGLDFPISQMLQTPLGYYICLDHWECIARFSGWNEPPKSTPQSAPPDTGLD